MLTSGGFKYLKRKQKGQEGESLLNGIFKLCSYTSTYFTVYKQKITLKRNIICSPDGNAAGRC